MFFHKPLKTYYVFANCSSFLPHPSPFLLVCRNYTGIVGEKKTSACSPLLPVKDKEKASTCFTQQVWYLLLWCALLKLHFHPQTKGLLSEGRLYFVPRNTLFLSAVTRDREAHGEERKTTVDRPDWRKDIY